MSWSAGSVDGIEHRGVHGKAILVVDSRERCKPVSAGDSRYLLQEAVELLWCDETVLVSINIPEGQGEEAVEFAPLFRVLHGFLRPLDKCKLIMAPVVLAPWGDRSSNTAGCNARGNSCGAGGEHRYEEQMHTMLHDLD